jgi:hypothetical protein
MTLIRLSGVTMSSSGWRLRLLGVEFALAQAEIFGCYFQEFVIFDEVQALFEAEDDWRSQLYDAVGAG